MSTLTETQKNILESDEFVLSETRKIQYAYGLKHVTRYSIDRHEEIQSESVAEHVYALHLLADYFLPLEDPEKKMDWNKIHDMLQYHDIDEIETGDTIGYLKTDADRAREAEAASRVIANFPASLQPRITNVLDEYEAQETAEAKFSKALDRIEPQFHIFTTEGKKLMMKTKPTVEQHDKIKESYLQPYPYMYRFYRVAREIMLKEGFFAEG